MWSFDDKVVNDVNDDDKYKEEKNRLFQQVEEKKKEIFDLIDSYSDSDTSTDIKDLVSKGIKMYVGGHVVNFEISDIEELPADKLKEDVKVQFQEKLVKIKESIESKLDSLSESYESLREKLDDEIEKAKVDNSKVEMPEIKRDHAVRGLSVVMGNVPEEFIWLYRGQYMVNTIDGKYVEIEMTRKTSIPMIVEIKTHGKDVVNVKLKKPRGLSFFRHYHSTDSGTTDCWGDWDYHLKWETADDIIDIGRHALNILKDVNTDSPGESSPPGLPTIDQLIESKNKRQNGNNDESENDDNEAEDDSPAGNYVWTI